MDTEKLLKMTKRRHPDYTDKEAHWAFLYSTYESSREWFVANLFRFTREGEETYEGRLKRAYRFNHTREIVDLVNKYLFKTEPQRQSEVPSYIERFRIRATKSGLSVGALERQAARLSSIYGRVYAVVDNNMPVVERPVSEIEVKTNDIALYTYIVTPLDFLDCGYDSKGDFEWVLLREIIRDDNDPFTSSGEELESFRLWTKTEWYLIEKPINDDGTRAQHYQIGDHGAHSLGAVPVIKCDHIESDELYSVPALIEDIAYLDRAVANYLSNLDQIINDQTFSQLVMPAQSMLPGTIGNSGANRPGNDLKDLEAKRNLIKYGTSQILLYDGEHGASPSYISPDPRQAALILTAIKQIINEIYHTVGLAGERTKQDNAVGIDNSSGVAKAFDFERVNALLSAKANAMQVFSNRLENMVRAWHGEKIDDAQPQKPAILYSPNFDVRNLVDEIAIASQLSILAVPMEIRRKQIKSVFSKIWPLMTEKESNDIDLAIAKWEDALYAPANKSTSPLTYVESEKTPGGNAADLPETPAKRTATDMPSERQTKE